MPKLIGLIVAAMLLSPSASPVHEQFAKYKAVEAYEVRPGVLMMPSYSSDGQICEIGLEALHYSPEAIRLGSSLPRKDVDQIFDELVPPNERGPLSKDFAGTVMTQPGSSVTTYIGFQNVLIQIYGDVSPSAGKSATGVDEVVAATLKWNNRKCQ